MVKSTAAAGNEPLGTSPERKHVTADNVMDAPDQMSEGAAKRNTAVVTGFSPIPYCNKQQDQTGNTLPTGKLTYKGIVNLSLQDQKHVLIKNTNI